jgi:hypothetical protein
MSHADQWLVADRHPQKLSQIPIEAAEEYPHTVCGCADRLLDGK